MLTVSFCVLPRKKLATTILVFNTNNVVLAEVRPRLDLQHFQRNAARVFQAVLGANRNKSGLVLGQQELLAVNRHLPGTGEDHPVLGAVVMHLHREGASRFHRDAVDVEARSLDHHVAAAPGAVNLAVTLILAALVLLEELDRLLHVLGTLAVHHQHGVLGADNHQVLHANGRHQLLVAVDVAVFAVVHPRVATEDIALLVFRADLPQGGPGADVAPVGIETDHHRVGGFLHHRVVHGLVRALAENVMRDTDEVTAVIGGIHRGLAGFQDIRAEFGQLGEIFFGAEHKHAAVPVVLPGGKVGFSTLAIRFLHEAGHLVRGVGAVGEGHAALDVSIAGFRGVRHDTEGDQMAFIGILLGDADGVVEDRLVIDDMVGSEHQHQRIISLAGGLKGRQGDGRGGVAPDRLENNVVRQLVELTQLFGHQKAVFFVTDDHRFIDFKARESGDGFLQHRVLPKQAEELFWIKLAGHRPETTAGTTSHNYRK